MLEICDDASRIGGSSHGGEYMTRLRAGLHCVSSKILRIGSWSAGETVTSSCWSATKFKNFEPLLLVHSPSLEYHEVQSKHVEPYSDCDSASSRPRLII